MSVTFEEIITQLQAFEDNPVVEAFNVSGYFNIGQIHWMSRSVINGKLQDDLTKLYLDLNEFMVDTNEDELFTDRVKLLSTAGYDVTEIETDGLIVIHCLTKRGIIVFG